MDLSSLLSSSSVRRARLLLHSSDADTLREQIDLARIPAPPLHEAARAEQVRARFTELGLTRVHVDEVGNVLATLPGEPRAGGHNEASPVVLSAHLDTVFPPETELLVRQSGSRIYAPGIADNARGLAAMLAVARVLGACEIRTAAPLTFVATVGEEGIGDLRGVKHLFRDDSPLRGATAFVSLDGPGLRRIVHRAVGSRRLRITFEGPGGHSWADWGVPNPVETLGQLIAELRTIELPSPPRTALSATRVGGGTSINSIPAEAWVELDLRGEALASLVAVDRQVRTLAERATAAANAQRHRGTPVLRCTIAPLGDRPAGATPTDSTLVQAAIQATRTLGAQPSLLASSTDANVPMALGIPAVTLGAGGEAGGTHTTGEWYSNDEGPRGIERALITVLAVAGIV